MEPAADTHPETHSNVEAADRRAMLIADLILTILGLVLLLPYVLWLWWLGAWLGASVSRCDGHPCNDIAAAGMATAALGPSIVWIIAVVASIVLLVLRRRASWIPPVAFLAATGVHLAGVWLANEGADVLL